VGVVINETWRNSEAICIDNLFRAARHFAYFADASAVDGDIGLKTGTSGAIYNCTATDQYIVRHDNPPDHYGYFYVHFCRLIIQSCTMYMVIFLSNRLHVSAPQLTLPGADGRQIGLVVIIFTVLIYLQLILINR
jgi:hypothetical protein